MNLNINYNKQENEISGYTNISLSDKMYLQQLGEIPVQSCDHVMISDCLNRVDEEEAKDIINKSCSVLAINGKISIQLLDFKYFCVSFLSGSLDNNATNSIVGSTQSVLEIPQVKEILHSNQIKIVNHTIQHMTTLIDGVKNAIS